METKVPDPRNNGKRRQKTHKKTNKLDIPNKCRGRESQPQTRRKPRIEAVTFEESQTGHRTTTARHGKLSATIAEGRDILRKYADQRT